MHQWQFGDFTSGEDLEPGIGHLGRPENIRVTRAFSAPASVSAAEGSGAAALVLLWTLHKRRR